MTRCSVTDAFAAAFYRKALLLFSLLFCIGASGQPPALRQEKLTASVFDGYRSKVPEKRKMLSLKGKPLRARINPLNYAAAGAFFVYQRIFSEQVQASCMYEISCSERTKMGIQQHGLAGFLEGIDQWGSCFPQVVYDYPDFMISPESKIRNHLPQ